MTRTDDRRLSADTDGSVWQLAARCRDADHSLFFHPDGERGHARRLREQRAKQVCTSCPVLAQCRTYSLAFEEPFGTWGGLTEDERSALLPARAARMNTHSTRAGRATREHPRDKEVAGER
ncbi:WhiB family transcriptional regulator [Mycobacterium sp. GA-2829]|uniref:WhiB family transcriptional regulator n=1 Tax=Mycobacterium sp. GA-2829 TaxID=1772283 RepID=UPI00073FE853|nr:WhiB family transcriptional regulator [Mycobacterium sp. GA-2829]KUI31715.1 hypothetical protein AU194_06950 [Mycobacterium sp. GA-2829]